MRTAPRGTRRWKPVRVIALGVIDSAAGPSERSGELVYEDFKAVENRARGLMQRNIKFREDISPYRENNRFDELVSKFDTAGGWSAPITLHAGR